MPCKELEAQIRDLRRTLNSYAAVLIGLIEALDSRGTIRRSEILDSVERREVAERKG